jgi:hypothetical protein
MELSRTYGLASREMSLVAVVKRSGDRPGELPETRVVPVGMPQDTEFDAYFRGRTPHRVYSAASAVTYSGVPLDVAASIRFASPPARDVLFSRIPDADLVRIAALLEPDGGMPGKSAEERAARSCAAVLAFVAEGHTSSSGAFRLHVERLVKFLMSISVASDRVKRLVEQALDAASTGTAPAGDWLRFAREPGTRWNASKRP